MLVLKASYTKELLRVSWLFRWAGRLFVGTVSLPVKMGLLKKLSARIFTSTITAKQRLLHSAIPTAGEPSEASSGL